MIDQLIVSIDWKQIELVLLGEFSGDPEFAKAYGQLPYEDLHLTAACTVLSAIRDYGVTADEYKLLRLGTNPFPFKLLDTKGSELPPEKFYGYMRGTAGGKGANFEWPYSGYLANLGERWGLSPQQTMELTNAYNERFKVAAAWRTETIMMGKLQGYVELPDHHRRVRYEATPEWRMIMAAYFNQLADIMNGDDSRAIKEFGRIICDRIQRRAGNQLINALIQGSCAALAKRSLLRIPKRAKELGMRARFLQPIHDELVFSVAAEEVLDFIDMAKAIMADHPDIVKTLKIDSSASIGRTFQPWDEKKSPYGQIELDEAPKAAFIPTQFYGKALPREAANDVVAYLTR